MEAGMMWQNVISQIERHSATYWWKLKREYSQVLKRFFQSQEKTSRRKKSVRKVSASDQIASGVLIKYFSKQMAVCRFSCTQCKSFTAPSLHWESLLETSASMQKHENKSPEKVGKNNWETIPLKNILSIISRVSDGFGILPNSTLNSSSRGIWKFIGQFSVWFGI